MSNLYLTPYNVDLDTMTDEKEIRDYLQKVNSLPEAIQNIFTEESTSDFIETQFGSLLDEEQMRDLTQLIGDILWGDLFIGDVMSTISEVLEIDMPTAKQIGNKIVFELFAPAIEDIKKIQREKFAGRLAEIIKEQAAPTIKPAAPAPITELPKPPKTIEQLEGEATPESKVSPTIQSRPQMSQRFTPRLDPMTRPKQPKTDVNPSNVVDLRNRN